MPTKMLSLGWYNGTAQAMFKGLVFYLSTIDTKHSIPQNQKLYFNSFYLAGERLKEKIKVLRFVRITRFSTAIPQNFQRIYFWLSGMIAQTNFCSAFSWAIYTLQFAEDSAWGCYFILCFECFKIHTKWQYCEFNSVEENPYHTNPEKQVIFLVA